jgi:hypothetical protein
MKKILQIELKGGIGNQLFQYYAGFYSSKISSRVLVFSNQQIKYERFVKSRIQLGMKIYGLDQIKGIKNNKFWSRWRNIFLFDNKFIQKFIKKIKPESFVNFSPNGEPGTNIDICNLNFNDCKLRVIKLSGYFQSPEIVSEAIKLGALTQIECKKPTKEFTFYMKEVKKISPIGIHVRLLDYYSNIPFLRIKKYISAAVAYFTENHDNSPLWFFSDNLEVLDRILPEEFKNCQNTFFGPNDFSDVETLILLSSCKYLVLSRSTFSYWAGFFQKSQLVAYPDSKSMENDFENYDLLSAFPITWKKIIY